MQGIHIFTLIFTFIFTQLVVYVAEQKEQPMLYGQFLPRVIEYRRSNGRRTDTTEHPLLPAGNSAYMGSKSTSMYLCMMYLR